jgi:hypothetical protein
LDIDGAIAEWLRRNDLCYLFYRQEICTSLRETYRVSRVAPTLPCNGFGRPLALTGRRGSQAAIWLSTLVDVLTILKERQILKKTLGPTGYQSSWSLFGDRFDQDRYRGRHQHRIRTIDRL